VKCLGFAELLKQAKTLPQVVETCDFIRKRECCNCFGQCEYEGTEHYKGKWVSVDVLKPLIPKIEEALAFIDHIQEHINHGDKGVRKDAHVICKFCGRTPKEIVDFNRACQT